MPLGKAISEIWRQSKWIASTQGVDSLFTINTVSYSYNHLAKYFSNIEIWTTDD